MSNVPRSVRRDNDLTKRPQTFCLQLFRADITTHRCRSVIATLTQIYMSCWRSVLSALLPFEYGIITATISCFVATIIDSDPHDANQITGSGSGHMGYYNPMQGSPRPCGRIPIYTT
jgi:hypothetical protein